MNINEIKEKILSLTTEESHIRLPFLLISSAIETTKRESGMDIHEFDIQSIHFFRVVNGIKAVLEHLEIEFDYPLLENGEIDAYATYDQFIEVYDMLEFNTLWRYNELLNAEVELAEKERINIGQFENRILNVIEKAVIQIEKISDIATDKKKLGGLIKEFKKQVPELSELLKGNKAEK